MGDFAGKVLSLHALAFQKCIPLSVTLEITLRCNLRCVHCYNFDRDRPYGLPQVKDELSGPEILRIIDEVWNAGCLFLSLTGGEALLHPQLPAFVRHARAHRMYVTVKSNGTLADTEAVDALCEAGANAMDISLYGATAATHDSFVKATGAFDKTLRGARTARAAGLRVKFSFVLVKGNASEVEAMIALAESLGVPYGLDPQLTARYDGTRSSLDLRVDPDTLEKLYRGPLLHLIPAPDTRPSRSVQCACARSVCGISAQGEVYPCIGAPLPSGNLRHASFAEIWQGSPALNQIRGLRLSDFKACEPCEHRPYCRRSSGVIYNNTGDYTGPAKVGDEWTCQEAEVLHRIHDDGKPAAAHPSAGALRRHSVDIL